MYTSGEAWITYGSFEGKWADQVRAVTEEEFKNVRNSTWVYGHPRSFRVGLTQFLYDHDFKDTNGDYFVKASERGFMFRWLELAGYARTKYISDALVHYRWRNDNTVLSTPKRVKNALLKYISGLETSQPIEWIHRVFGELIWKMENFQKNNFFEIFFLFQQLEFIHFSTLTDVILGVEDAQVLKTRLIQLQRQTVVNKIKLNILVRSSSTKSMAEKIVNEPMNASNFESISIHETRPSTNSYFGFERLRIARHLLQSTLVDFIIFFDESSDFETFRTNYDENYISQLWASRKKHAHLGWRGKSFSANGDFWTNTSPTFEEIVKAEGGKLDQELGA